MANKKEKTWSSMTLLVSRLREGSPQVNMAVSIVAHMFMQFTSPLNICTSIIQTYGEDTLIIQNFNVNLLKLMFNYLYLNYLYLYCSLYAVFMRFFCVIISYIFVCRQIRSIDTQGMEQQLDEKLNSASDNTPFAGSTMNKNEVKISDWATGKFYQTELFPQCLY